MLSKVILRLMPLIVGALLASCGGDSNDETQQSEPNVVELRSQVQQIAADDARGFGELTVGELVQASGEPLAEGAVLILDGKALKIVSRMPGAGGSMRYATVAPKLADLFERIRIVESVTLSEATPGDGRMHRLATVPIPSTRIQPDLGDASDFVELSGSIESAQGTVVFDWSLAEGLKRSEVSLQGRLGLRGSIGVKQSEEQLKKRFEAGTVSVPIPVSGYAVSFELPVSVEVTVASAMSVTLASYTRAFDFTAGARYDPSSSAWLNLSRFDDAGSNFSPLDISSARAALQSLGAFVRAQLLNQGTTSYTLAKVTVVPAISPSLVLLKSVAAAGVRLGIATSGAVEANGVFPDVLSCTKVPLAVDLRVFGFYDVPVYDLSSPYSLFDPDLKRSEFSLFSLAIKAPSLHTSSGCNDGRPYSSTITTTAVNVEPEICGYAQNGVCLVSMYCTPDGAMGDVEVLDERWTLAASSLIAELKAAEGSSESYRLSGTYQPTTGAITVAEATPFTEVLRSAAPDGTTVVYYSGGSSSLSATFDPVTGAIVGTGTLTTVTRWNRDAREARCESTISYRSLPKI